MEMCALQDDYHYQDRIREDILAMIPADGQKIGSIGCGWAATEAELVRRGRFVHGADVNAELIEKIACRLTSAHRIEPDEEYPFAFHSLDGLILADVIEHLPMAWSRLTSYARMVKPGGWIVISTPNMRHLEVLWQLGVRGDWPEEPLGTFDQTHIQILTHARLQRWCTAAGLTLDSWHYSYDYRFLRRNIYRALDLITLRRLHGLFGCAVQGIFRKSPT
jgi:2-polyprenyl-3-methyl-5-hydroxy-6-metoxy-1,4-benzoquinol methylase